MTELATPQRKRRRKTKTDAVRYISTKPLRPHIRAAALAVMGGDDFRMPGNTRGLNTLARIFTARHGLSVAAWAQNFNRVFRHDRMTVDLADRMALALGYHPLNIWGDEWCPNEDEDGDG